MKRLVVLLVAALISSVDIFALNDTTVTGIRFEHGTWSEITAKAKLENKMIFLDAFASWCSPCKWMAKNIFPNDTVGQFYNQNFVCAKIDMEKGEGISIAKKFWVKAYPTFLYISSDGEMLMHRTCGSTSADEFLKNGKNALNPDSQMVSFKKRFESNISNPNEVIKYLGMLQDACMDNKNEVSAYLKTQKEKDLISPENWKIMLAFLSDPSSKEFKYILLHRGEFEKAYSKEVVNNKIAEVYGTGLMESLKKDDKKSYESMKKEIKRNALPDGEKIILNAELKKFQKEKDWKNYSKAAELLIEKYSNDDATLLNKISWTIYENVTDKAVLLKAADWAKKATEINNIYSFTDTYASVLYKLGKKAEAREAALKAIELAKKENADFKETELLLEKIDKMN
ncbi:MAG: DUF255 domain-containing protein [Clostridiales bacterium]